MNPVVERILKAAKAKGLNQRHLASKLEIHPQVITDWKNKSTSYMQYMDQLTDVLDVSADYLLTGQERQQEITENPVWDAAKELFVQLSQEQQLEYIADMAKKVGQK